MAKRPKQPEPQVPDGFVEVGGNQPPADGSLADLPTQDPITLLQGDNIRMSAEILALRDRVNALSTVILENYGKVI